MVDNHCLRSVFPNSALSSLSSMRIQIISMSVLSLREPTQLTQLAKLMTSLLRRKRRQRRRWKMELRKKLRILLMRSQSHSPNFTRISWYRPSRMCRCVCEWHVRRNSASRKISYLRSLSIDPTTPLASVLTFSRPSKCSNVSRSVVEVYSSSLAAGRAGSQAARSGGQMNLSFSSASSSRISRNSTRLFTKSSSSLSSRAHSNSSRQLLSRKLNSLAKFSSRERSNSSPARNSSQRRSSRQRERCSDTVAFFSDTRSENSATPCLALRPRNTRVSTRLRTKRASLRGLVRLVSLSTSMPEFLEKDSTNSSTCDRCTDPSARRYYWQSSASPRRSSRQQSATASSFPRMGLRSRCSLNLHWICSTPEKSAARRGMAEQSWMLPRTNWECMYSARSSPSATRRRRSMNLRNSCEVFSCSDLAHSGSARARSWARPRRSGSSDSRSRAVSTSSRRFMRVRELKKEMFIASERKFSELSASVNLHAARSACRCCSCPSTMRPATYACWREMSAVSPAQKCALSGTARATLGMNSAMN